MYAKITLYFFRHLLKSTVKVNNIVTVGFHCDLYKIFYNGITYTGTVKYVNKPCDNINYNYKM